MKKIVKLIAFLACSSILAQGNVNNYKYIIVPSQFDFVKDVDKYQTSSLTKFLFNKYGFTAFLDNEKLPDEVTFNKCKALIADVVDDSKMLSTKSTIELKDCHGKVVFKSEQGFSREKDYKKAYHATIREAFESVKRLNYKYSGSNDKVMSEEAPVRVKPVKEAPQVVAKKPVTKTEKKLPVLKASLVDNGLLLKNNKNEEVFTLLKSRFPNVYIIKDKNGTLTKNEQGVWVADFYDKNGKQIMKEYKIEF